MTTVFSAKWSSFGSLGATGASTMPYASANAAATTQGSAHATRGVAERGRRCARVREGTAPGALESPGRMPAPCFGAGGTFGARGADVVRVAAETSRLC